MDKRGSLVTSLSSISAFVERRWGSWGIPIFALWSLILAVLAISRLLLLSLVQFTDNAFGNPTIIWFNFLLNVILVLGFGASTYGLWGRRNWGRVLFLWLVVIWAGSNMIALLANPDQNHTIGALLINGLRFAVSAFIPLLYFNLPHIKTAFHSKTSETF